MNPFNLPLAPTLQADLSQSGKQSGTDAINNSRDLFYALIHISEHYHALPVAYQYVKQQLDSINDNYAADFSSKYSPAHLGLLIKKASGEHPYPLPGSELNACLKQYAPVFFTELSWLGNITHAATSQSPLAIELMAVYLRLINAPHTIANNRDIYHAWVLNAGIQLPTIHTITFAQQTDVSDEIFDFAALQLALGQFPRVFFPEILGFTLSYCQSLSLPEQFFPDPKTAQLPGFFAARTGQRQQELAQIGNLIKAYINEFSEETDAIWQRIQCGFRLHQHHLERCDQALSAHFHGSLSPRQAMEKLVVSLLPGAIGNHGKIRLGSRTLDEWFSEKPFKSANFLASLLLSPYIDRTKPENSKLLTLFEFNGPMFGVLDDNGKTVVKDWLMSELNPGLQKTKKAQSAQVKVGLKTITASGAAKSASAEITFTAPVPTKPVPYGSLSNRELYFYLVNNDLYPGVLPVAKAKVQRILTISRYINRLPLRHYSHPAFDKYIETLYQKEKKAYKPLGRKPNLPKEAYVWGIEQFAPTILTDGCWLQNVQQLNYFPNHTIGAYLYKIYRDECGNGVQEQNHPHIYQQLLDSQHIKLPAINTKEFSKHPCFIDSAFDIPVYLMAISKFPNFFLPELLGLNLAIEISGLGNVYLRLSEELKFYGIQSAIVDVHTSIDNLATGHTALAVNAIKFYLDDIAANFGDDVMQAHWRRIHTGYCSLTTASLCFKYSLIKHYKLKRPQDATTGKPDAPPTEPVKAKAPAK
ncbi:MAG: iron-containing redox enzyme family protein [Gammaproteobacteria bacterium]|nr:iron-containing redox enzyme family protein [Gammaproteobacteria bacterium]